MRDLYPKKAVTERAMHYAAARHCKGGVGGRRENAKRRFPPDQGDLSVIPPLGKGVNRSGERTRDNFLDHEAEKVGLKTQTKKEKISQNILRSSRTVPRRRKGRKRKKIGLGQGEL